MTELWNDMLPRSRLSESNFFNHLYVLCSIDGSLLGFELAVGEVVGGVVGIMLTVG